MKDDLTIIINDDGQLCLSVNVFAVFDNKEISRDFNLEDYFFTDSSIDAHETISNTRAL